MYLYLVFGNETNKQPSIDTDVVCIPGFSSMRHFN